MTILNEKRRTPVMSHRQSNLGLTPKAIKNRASGTKTNMARSKNAFTTLRILFGLTGIAIAAAAIAWLVRTDGMDFDQVELHTITRQPLRVVVQETGTLESSENIEIKSKVRGDNTITWVVENGVTVQAGDEILRLDTLLIEDEITERTKNAHASRSGADHWKANVEKARIAIEEYDHGRFKTQLMELEKNRTIADSNLTTAKNILGYQQQMRDRGYVSELDVDQQRLNVQQFKLIKEFEEIQIDVLENFSRHQESERLLGDYRAAQAEYLAAAERTKMDAIRRDLAISELANCTIRAKRAGTVLYPTKREWDRTPPIEEGATVHQEQLLLLMPNLDRMQVKIGIHESIVERVQEGLSATVQLPRATLTGTVSEVATVARAGGWWTGGVIKYDTIVQLPPGRQFKPGKSAKVELVLAHYDSVVTIPVDAVVQSNTGSYCWVREGNHAVRRALMLADTDDKMIVVQDGVDVGEEVVLMPAKWIDEAKREAGKRRVGISSPADHSTQRPTAAVSG